MKRFAYILSAAFLGLILFTVVSCTESGQNSSNLSLSSPIPLTEQEMLSYRACDNDTDCVFVNNGCCDCANGGKEAAINKNFVDEFNGQFACEDISCTAMARIPACGSGSVSCLENKCEYIPLAVSPLPEEEMLGYRDCDNNADCVFVNNGCCDCANGGKEAAINKNFVDEFNGRFACEGIPCTEMARTPKCGSGSVSCLEGKCEYSMTTSSPLSEDDLRAYSGSCNSADDCMFVNNGCCDCANGGKEAAINKAYIDAFTARFDCSDVMCTMRARVNQPCGCGTVDCVNGSCIYSMDGCNNGITTLPHVKIEPIDKTIKP